MKEGLVRFFAAVYDTICTDAKGAKSAHQDRSKSNIKVRPHVASILAMSTSCTCPSMRSAVVVLAAASLSIFNSPISLTRLATTTHHKLHHEFGTHAMDMCELVATT